MRLSFVVVFACLAVPASARDSLGVFGDWGAFRDPEVPRCYAIAAAQADGSRGYASVGNWPQLQVRGQAHFRLSRSVRAGSEITLTISGERFALRGSGSNAFAPDRLMDARIVAAMRAASSMQLTGRDTQGRTFTDRYALEGAATAMDAASVGCANTG